MHNRDRAAFLSSHFSPASLMGQSLNCLRRCAVAIHECQQSTKLGCQPCKCSHYCLLSGIMQSVAESTPNTSSRLWARPHVWKRSPAAAFMFGHLHPLGQELPPHSLAADGESAEESEQLDALTGKLVPAAAVEQPAPAQKFRCCISSGSLVLPGGCIHVCTSSWMSASAM